MNAVLMLMDPRRRDRTGGGDEDLRAPGNGSTTNHAPEDAGDPPSRY